MALEKSLTFMLFILVGFLIRKNFANKDQVNGIKNIILTIALPATIFVALMRVEVELSMLLYPALALAINLLLYAIMPVILRLFGVQKDSKEARTLKLLLPSLAPGLSCFPFILEFLGEEELAFAALADVGNKVFVLIILYVIAMNMYLRLKGKGTDAEGESKLKSLVVALFKEPINLVMIAAIALLCLGFNLDTLPGFISDAAVRFGAMMSPLILLFIGLAVKVKKEKLGSLIGLLLSRAGITLLLSAGIIYAFNITAPSMMLLAVVFPLSSCSFWPFAHMSAFNAREKEAKSFDLDLALLVLALSLPLSTMLILGILADGEAFTHLPVIAITGLLLVISGLVPALVKRMKWKLRMPEAPLGKEVAKSLK